MPVCQFPVVKPGEAARLVQVAPQSNRSRATVAEVAVNPVQVAPRRHPARVAEVNNKCRWHEKYEQEDKVLGRQIPLPHFGSKGLRS